jgi:hypothetical protein
MSDAPNSPDRWQWRAARLCIFALAVVGALAGVAMLWWGLTQQTPSDVRAYYEAGARLNAGLPLYPAGADTNAGDFYRYPPLLAIVFRPLAMLPFQAAAAVWEATVVAAFALTLLRLGVRRPATWLGVGILGIPIAFVLVVGQAQSVVTLLVAVGSPAAVALAGQLKVFPVLAGIWWVGRRDWRAVAILVAWSCALLLTQLILEPQATVDFVRSIGLGWVGTMTNLSPYVVSPLLWAGFVLVMTLAALWRAHTPAGWPLAVALATFAPPRLPFYLLMLLLAAVRSPDDRAAPAVRTGKAGRSMGAGTADADA